MILCVCVGGGGGGMYVCKNAWIVGIGPSKTKLWLMELDESQRTICKDVNLHVWYDQDKF